MESNRTAGQSARFVISTLDPAGAAYAVTAASWAIYDEAGASLVTGSVAPADIAASSVTFTVAGTSLVLAAGVPSAGREIVVTITTPDGPIELREYFVLVSATPLLPFTNSVMSYAEALAVRESFGPDMGGWDGATNHQQRINALINAHANLARLVYSVPHDAARLPSDYAGYGTGSDTVFDMRRRLQLSTLNATSFAALPASFVQALKRAQLVEADTILGGDIVGDKRRDGVVSETIGESSTFFQSKPLLDLPIGRRAYAILRPYISISVGVSR